MILTFTDLKIQYKFINKFNILKFKHYCNLYHFYSLQSPINSADGTGCFKTDKEHSVDDILKLLLRFKCKDVTIQTTCSIRYRIIEEEFKDTFLKQGIVLQLV